MYSTNSALIEQLKLKAEEIVVKTDRLPYEKFIKAGEIFAAENNLIVASTPGISSNKYQYEFYSDRVVKDSKKLAETIYDLDPDGLAHYTVLITKIVNSIMTISVDSRELFRIKSLPVIRGVKLTTLIDKVKIPAQFAKDGNGDPIQLLCIGHNMQLMSIYKILINPLNAANWNEIIPLEATVRAAVIAAAGTATVSGTAPRPNSKQIELMNIIMKKYAAGFGRVLIGTKAIEVMGITPPVIANKLQFICSNNIESEAEYIMNLLPTDELTFHWKIDELNNPYFPKFRRLTLHYEEKGYRHLFLDVYNSAEFTAIPYNVHPSGVRIGSMFVLLLFKLIDILSIQILAGMDRISEKHSSQLYGNLMNEFQIISSKEEKDITALFPLTYVGFHENEDLAQLRNMQALKESRHIPFYPLMHLAHRR
jgi:hypothetical protein